MKNGYKIFVKALNYQGCSGIQGNFTIINIDEIETLYSSIIVHIFFKKYTLTINI